MQGLVETQHAGAVHLAQPVRRGRQGPEPAEGVAVGRDHARIVAVARAQVEAVEGRGRGSGAMAQRGEGAYAGRGGPVGRQQRRVCFHPGAVS